MKKYFLFITSLMVAFFAMGIAPEFAFAHEHQVFKVGDKYYQFTVGSLNEPIAVDDKTGVDLRVEMITAEHAQELHTDAPGMVHAEEKFPPVTSLDKTLKVELSAGSEKKVLNMNPAYNDPGAYKANFIPTLQTTYAYRFFGTINNAPVDVKFTCSTGDTGAAVDDGGMMKISDAVMRISKVGAFGCPMAKADLGFPQSAPTLGDLKTSTQHALDQAMSADQSAQTARSLGIVGIVIGLIAFAIVGIGIVRSRKSQ